MAADFDDEIPKSKSGSKKLIIILLLVLLAGGGGAAAAWFFFLQHPAEHKEEAPKPQAPKPPVFMSLETFTVNLQPDPDDQYLQVDVTLKVGGPEVVEAIKLHMPEVRNRMLMLLSSKKSSEISTPEGKKQLIDEIIAQLKEPFNVGEKPQDVTGVFFTSFVIQ